MNSNQYTPNKGDLPGEVGHTSSGPPPEQKDTVKDAGKNTHRNWMIVTLLFLGVLMGALDISIVGPAIPSIEQAMHTSEKEMTWIFSIYVLFNLVGISLMAKLSDLFGRRSVYILALLIFGAGSLVVALAPGIDWLLAGRGIQGFGSSGIFPVALAVIGDIFPKEKRGRMLGLIGAVFGLAFIIGPFIAGFVLLWFSWNVLFLLNLPLVILLIIGALFLLPNHRVITRKSADWEGIVILAIILGAFTLAINLIDPETFPKNLGEWPILPLLLLTAILTPLLLMMEAKQEDPVVNVRLFRSRQVTLVGIVAFGLGLFQSAIVFFPLFSVERFGVTPSTASFMLLPLVAATAIGSPLGGRLTDRFGSRWIIATGLFITVGSFVLMASVEKSINLFYVAGAVLGLGLSMRAALNYIMLNEAPLKERASTQGMLIIFISIGQLTGAALLGILTSLPGGLDQGFPTVFMAMGGLALVLFLLSLMLKSRKNELKTSSDHQLEPKDNQDDSKDDLTASGH